MKRKISTLSLVAFGVLSFLLFIQASGVVPNEVDNSKNGLGLWHDPDNPDIIYRGATGGPGDGTCADCHTPGQQALNGTMSLTGLPGHVVALKDYTLTIFITRADDLATNAGFQMVALDADTSSTGEFSNPTNNSRVRFEVNRIYVEHDTMAFFESDTVVSWQVKWTAPDTPGDTVTFYLGGLLGEAFGYPDTDDSDDDTLCLIRSTRVVAPLSGAISAIRHVQCPGGSDGQATVEANGGIPPYTYQWSGISAQDSATASNLEAGTYDVTILDADSNTVVLSVQIEEPLPLQIEIADIVSATDGQANGAATLVVQGGTSPYSYGDSVFTDSIRIRQLAPGLHSFEIRDAHDCLETIDVHIGNVTSTDKPDKIEALSLSSNPTGGPFQLAILLAKPAEVSISIYDTSGKKLQETPMRKIHQRRFRMDLSRHSAGLYLVKIQIDKTATVRKLLLMKY